MMIKIYICTFVKNKNYSTVETFWISLVCYFLSPQTEIWQVSCSFSPVYSYLFYALEPKFQIKLSRQTQKLWKNCHLGKNCS